MEFVNKTNFDAGWTAGFQPDGREFLLVAVKGTFLIPENAEEESELAETQVPLTEADEFTGEPGLSAPLYETDYAHPKPYCDVLLNGSAHARGGEPTTRVTVSLQVGSMQKSFGVVGDRVWDKLMLKVSPSLALKFVQMPITYDCAYGGVDASEDQPERQKTYVKNPIGVGYYPLTKPDKLIGKPLPNTEEIGHPVKTSTGKYKPMSLGPIGRNFAERIPYAGTYDQGWFDHRCPFFPKDFDYRYFQSSPADQQIPYPQGGEEVVLKNLTPRGTSRFRLPKVSIPILGIPHSGKDRKHDAVLDTVLLEPDQGRFMLTWRGSLPLKQNLFEMKQLLVGTMPHGWHRARKFPGKPYYANLAELVEARMGTKGK